MHRSEPFILQNDNHLILSAGIALGRNCKKSKYSFGEDIVGQCAASGKHIFIK